MPRKTIKSLKDDLKTSRELNNHKHYEVAKLKTQLEEAIKLNHDKRIEVQKLEEDKKFLQRLCQELTVAVRTRS